MSGLDSPMLQAVATLSLVLVLFTLMRSPSTVEGQAARELALLILGPGTVVAAGASFGMSGLRRIPWPIALLLSPRLSPLDRSGSASRLRRPDLPSAARQAPSTAPALE